MLAGMIRSLLRCLLCSTILAGGAVAQAAAAGPAPRWWKGNLHTHSLWSDGDDFPEMIADWYRRHGYHFLALSDHNVLSEGERWMRVDDVVRRGGRLALARYRDRFGDDWVQMREVDGKQEVRLRGLAEFRPLLEEAGGFLLLQAEEVSASFDRLPLHQNATNLVEVIEPRSGGSVRDTIAANLLAILAQGEALAQPVLPHLNHPNFYYAVTAEDLAEVLQERFFEVWNGHPSVHHTGDHHHAPVERLWDVANTLRIARLQAPPLFGLGTDDSHHYFAVGPARSNSGRGWVMVRAAELTAPALLAALDRGDFYASSGVVLRDVRFEDDTLTVAIAGEPGVSYLTWFLGTRVDHDPGFRPVQDETGRTVRATYRYSDEVGAVLAAATGLEASYRLRGDELYVRAVVAASQSPPRPVYDGQVQQAWTQPVGWQHRVRPVTGPRFAAAECSRDAGLLGGIATDRVQHVYWSFPTAVVQTDAAGRVRATSAQGAGFGDLTFWLGEVYALADVRAADGTAASGPCRVEVFAGADLTLRRSHVLPDHATGVAGICAVGGRFLLARATGDDAGGIEVQDHDGAFRLLGRRRCAVTGVRAVRTLEFGEGRLWFGCQGDGARLVVTDLDLQVVLDVALDAGHGLAAVEDGRMLLGGMAGARARVQLARPDPGVGLRPQ